VTFELVVQATVGGLVIGAIYALIAAGLTLIFGVMDILNVAHGAMVMLGMYGAYWLFTLYGVDPYVSLLAIMPVLFVFGMVIHYLLIGPMLGQRPINLLLMTLGIMLFLENMALLLWTPDFRTLKVGYASTTVHIGPALLTLPRLIGFVVALVLTGALYVFLTRTMVGKAIRACASNATGAALIGINPNRMYAIAFGVGVACAGAAGVVVVPFFYVSPHVGLGFLLPAFVVIVLGGLGNFWGALVGGVIVGLVEALGALVIPASAKQILSLGIFVLILFFRPQGLFGARSA
jgi:branched-chain amino acid transport system permease protein